MSQVLDQIKHNMRVQLGKVYKDLKTKMSPEEWREFESWFWKIRPHLEVDLTPYQSSQQSETSGPTIPSKEITPVDDSV